MKIYQYNWAPVTEQGLLNNAGSGMTIIPVSEYLINIQAEETQKEDLDAYMTSLGFAYVGEII